jgi:hypothetical protein
MENEDEDEDEIIWNPDAEMRRLLSAILSSSSSSSGAAGKTSQKISKKGANGMAAAVSSRLAKVRWAVVRDGDGMMFDESLMNKDININTNIR